MNSENRISHLNLSYIAHEIVYYVVLLGERYFKGMNITQWYIYQRTLSYLSSGNSHIVQFICIILSQ